jgi:hypothetical protein
LGNIKGIHYFNEFPTSITTLVNKTFSPEKRWTKEKDE